MLFKKEDLHLDSFIYVKIDIHLSWFASKYTEQDLQIAIESGIVLNSITSPKANHDPIAVQMVVHVTLMYL